MVDSSCDLTISRQCELLSISRTNLYYNPTVSVVSDRDIKLMNLIDELYTENPTRGTRRIRAALKKVYNVSIGRNKVRTLMQKMLLCAIYPKKRLSSPTKGHKKYPYLLRNKPITHVNHVWSTDITYIRLKEGFVYLIAIIDWYSRYVLSWQLSTDLESGFCCEVLEDALGKYPNPEIFNTDQGSQFTCDAFTSILKHKNIKISMDGKGRALDNVFVERLWRTVKQEEVYLNDYIDVAECRKSLYQFFDKYNNRREHQSLGYNYPREIYLGEIVFDVKCIIR